jgi:subtilisin family serine protease
MARLLASLLFASGALAAAGKAIPGAYMVKLTKEVSTGSGLLPRGIDQHELFHKRAEGLDYTVRHEFRDPDVYLGLSIHLAGVESLDEAKARLQSVPGVEAVHPVWEAHLPTPPSNTTVPVGHPYLSYPHPAPFFSLSGSGNLASALQMGGVDKLHALGIKGKGVKIGIIDTGVDYRHPALGGGFGPGYKIIGGHSFINDNGTVANSPDPLAPCFGGAHGTHVAG